MRHGDSNHDDSWVIFGKLTAFAAVFFGLYAAASYYFERVEERRNREHIAARAKQQAQQQFQQQAQGQRRATQQRPLPPTQPSSPSRAEAVPQRSAPAASALSGTQTIYLCRNYSGGEFWSNAPCASQNALIIRMTTVSASLSFSDQVAIARGQKAEAENRIRKEQATIISSGDSASSSDNTCKALDARIEYLDKRARQPHSPSEQDWIRQQRQNARDQQYRLRC